MTTQDLNYYKIDDEVIESLSAINETEGNLYTIDDDLLNEVINSRKDNENIY